MAAPSEGKRTVRPPYASEAAIRSFFERMKKMGDPGQIDRKWLESYSLGGSQPQSILGMLKWLGITDNTGKSTGKWNALRTSQQTVLAELVRESYASIFSAVDVDQATRAEIEGAFIHVYQSGDTGRVVTAFLCLSSLAGIDSPALKPAKSGGATKVSVAKSAAARKRASPPKARVSPADKTPAVPTRPLPVTAGPRQSHAIATVTFNVEIPGEWDADQVRKRVADVLEALASSEES